MSILDHLNETQIEDLLVQHDRYDLGGGLVVSRRDKSSRWFVYYQGLEVHCRFEAADDPVGYIDFLDAVDVALSPANQERWGI